MKGKRTYVGRPGQRVEEQGTWASRTQKHSEAGYGRPVDRGAWATKTVKRPRQQPAHPQYANYWAPLTRKQHTMPHSAQPQHTNYWAPRTRKRHQQEHRPQRLTERSNPTQHAKGRTGDCPRLCKGTTTRWNVTQGVHSNGRAAQRQRGASVVVSTLPWNCEPWYHCFTAPLCPQLIVTSCKHLSRGLRRRHGVVLNAREKHSWTYTCPTKCESQPSETVISVLRKLPWTVAVLPAWVWAWALQRQHFGAESLVGRW